MRAKKLGLKYESANKKKGENKKPEELYREEDYDRFWGEYEDIGRMSGVRKIREYTKPSHENGVAQPLAYTSLEFSTDGSRLCC